MRMLGLLTVAIPLVSGLLQGAGQPKRPSPIVIALAPESLLYAVAEMARRLNAQEENPRDEIPNRGFGFNTVRDQSRALDQQLVGSWHLYNINRAAGTPPVGLLTINSDKSYSYGGLTSASNAYTGTLLYGVPYQYRQYRFSYWRMDDPNANFYMRSGTAINNTPTVMIYDASTNRISTFGVPAS